MINTSKYNVNTDCITNEVVDKHKDSIISDKQFKFRIYSKFENAGKIKTLIQRLPNNIYCLCKKSKIFCLLIKRNLLHWRRISADKCTFCDNLESQGHIL